MVYFKLAPHANAKRNEKNAPFSDRKERLENDAFSVLSLIWAVKSCRRAKNGREIRQNRSSHGISDTVWLIDKLEVP